MNKTLKIISLLLYMELPLFTAHYQDNKTINGLKALGSFSSEWYIPSSQMTRRKNCCYCFGVPSDLSFEVGMLALSDNSIVCIDDDSLPKNTIERLRARIAQNKVAYIDNEKIYKLAPVKKNNLFFIEQRYPSWHSFIDNTAITADDIVKIIAKDESIYSIIHTLIKKKITPSVLCVDFTRLDHAIQNDLVKQITEYGYYASVGRQKKNLTFLRSKPVQKLKQNSIQEPHIIKDSMNYYMYRPDLFYTDPVITESKVYDLLVQSPLRKNVNYVATPWACLINKKIPFKDVEKNKLHGGFTVCQHVRYELILPYIKSIGLDTLFTPHVNKYYFGLHVLPFPHYPVNGTDPAVDKDIWYSFIGISWTHHIRKTLFAMNHPSNTVIKKRDNWHFFAKEKQQEFAKKEYENVLARSRFSLCPRGVGASTIRFWESLQAGAIPVLLADDMQLPEGIDWQECIVFIAEKDVNKIESILKSISLEQEMHMRENCLKIFEVLCKRDNFVNTIRWYVEDKLNLFL